MQDNAQPDRDEPDAEDNFVDRKVLPPDAEDSVDEDFIEDEETSELDQESDDDSLSKRRSFRARLAAIDTPVRLGICVAILAAVALMWWTTRPIEKVAVETPTATPEELFAVWMEQIRNGESTQLHTPNFPIDDKKLDAIPMDVLLEAAAQRASEASVTADESMIEAPLPPGAGRSDSKSVAPDVARSPKLDTVLIDQGIITDVGMGTLARIPDLRHLRLRLSPITDEGLKPLLDCHTLWFLNLPHSRITEKGVRSLAAIPKLRQLRLGSIELGNDASRAVAELKSLRGLHLIGVPVTDDGLKLIAELPHLESLYLDDSAVTDSGWNWLFTNHPQLHVHINQRHHDRDPHSHRHD